MCKQAYVYLSMRVRICMYMNKDLSCATNRAGKRGIPSGPLIFISKKLKNTYITRISLIM